MQLCKNLTDILFLSFMKYYGKMVFIEFLVFGYLMTIYILILNLYLLFLFYSFFLDNEKHLISFYFFTGESHVT